MDHIIWSKLYGIDNRFPGERFSRNFHNRITIEILANIGYIENKVYCKTDSNKIYLLLESWKKWCVPCSQRAWVPSSFRGMDTKDQSKRVGNDCMAASKSWHNYSRFVAPSHLRLSNYSCYGPYNMFLIMWAIEYG